MSVQTLRLLGSIAACTVVLVGATWAVERSVATDPAPDAASVAPPPPGSATLTISSFVFAPEPLSVAPGTTVAVTNQDKAKHTVTSGARDAPDDAPRPALRAGARSLRDGAGGVAWGDGLSDAYQLAGQEKRCQGPA